MTNPHKAETSTPELEAFLRSHVLRRLTGGERRAWLHELFTSTDPPRPERPDMDPQDLPHRIMVMWRITRTTAVIKGLCADDETLDASTDTKPDPWVEPFKPIVTPMAGAALRRNRAGALLKYHAEGEGLPLLPPRTDPDALKRWCYAAAIIAADLGVERTPEGLLGLQGLLDPEQAQWNDVSAVEVLSFEDTILNDAHNLLIDNGDRACITHFRENYGFALKEAKSLMRVVRTRAMEQSAASIEEARALTLARLEDILGRAKENLDVDTELKTIKEMSRIQGLTRTEPENQSAEFFATVKRVSGIQDVEKLDPRTLALLEGRKTEEVGPVTIDVEPMPQCEAEDDVLDEDAIIEYDLENQHE